jgi:glycosyltransferase involved in cell wall biosynthesis
MKVLLLANPLSTHLIKWANGLNERGIEILIFGLTEFDKKKFRSGIQLETFKAPQFNKWRLINSFLKITYVLGIYRLKKVIKEYAPDLVHSHYASSYGLLGALSGFHPFIISAWGSDISMFPNYSFLHRSLLTFNFGRADEILSTSKFLREEIRKYTGRKILLTPFGVDTKKFYPRKVESIFNKGDLIIGTIKTLEKHYGIEYLIKAFSIVKKRHPSKAIKLLIVGSGSQKKYLEDLVNTLGLVRDTLFTGYINQDEIQNYHNMFDIFVVPSVKESFGVSALEASACGKPVIVSNVGGLPEVVENEKTGLIVEKQNSSLLAESIEKLINNLKMREEFGNNGRQKVLREYDWQHSLDTMVAVYNSVVTK